MKPDAATPHRPEPTPEREIPSAHCDTLTLLHGPEAFASHLQQMLASGRRHVEILTQQLDPLLFADSEVCDQLSRLAREHRDAEIRILVKDPTPLFGRRHALVALQQRLTSKIKLRQLKIAPQNEYQGYIIVDQRQLLLQHRDGEFDGFSDTDTAPRARALLEEFNLLWQRQADDIAELRPLSL